MATKEQCTEFIKKIAPTIQKYAPKYGICVVSPIIAQACLESSYGTSNKAKHHNYFGLKYRKNRLTCNNGKFTDGSTEEYVKGTLTKISCEWFNFDSMDKGVEGYFQFIDTDNYKATKGIKDPKKYLEALKLAGYATNHDYVENNMSVIEKWNLTQYDCEEKAFTINKKYAQKKYNVTKKSGRSIKYLVIHNTGTNSSAENNCKYFSGGNRNASADFFIDKDGSIFQYNSDIKNYYSWHCGDGKGKYGITNANSIGIEVVSADAEFKTAQKESLRWLVHKLMTEYGIKKDSLKRHYDASHKSCPGAYCGNSQKNAKWTALKSYLLDTLPYKVKVTSNTLNVRKGAGTSYDIVEKIKKDSIYTIVEVKSGWGRLKNGKGWISLKYVKEL